MDLSIYNVKTKSSEEILDDLKEGKEIKSYSDIDTILFINEGLDSKIDSFIKIYSKVPKDDEEIKDFKMIMKTICEAFKDKLIIFESILFSYKEEPTEEEHKKELERQIPIMEELNFIDINKYYNFVTRNIYVYHDGLGLEFGFSIMNFINHIEKEEGDKNVNNRN